MHRVKFFGGPYKNQIKVADWISSRKVFILADPFGQEIEDHYGYLFITGVKDAEYLGYMETKSGKTFHLILDTYEDGDQLVIPLSSISATWDIVMKKADEKYIDLYNRGMQRVGDNVIGNCPIDFKNFDLRNE